MPIFERATPEHGPLLDRARLYVPLAAALAQACLPRVVLIVGMAGSGKTVAAAQWARHLPYPVVQTELQGGKQRLWTVFQAALAQADLPAARPAATLAAHTEPLAVVVDRLEAELDDHGVPQAELQTCLEVLLNNPALHVVLISQIFPVYPPLADLIANGQVQVIDQQALAFTLGEVQASWQQRQAQPLAPCDATTLLGHSDGLASMVALACATGWIGGPATSPIQATLVDHILGSLPPALRDMVLHLAVLPTLTPTTIKGLTGRDDGAQVVRLLRQRGLLAGDTQPTLHPLLRQAALEQLWAEPERWSQVARRAIALANAQGRYLDAWQLATESELWDVAQRVLLEASPALRQQGASRMVIAWVAQLPPALRTPPVMVWLARCQGDVGDLDGASLTLATLLATEADGDQRREWSIWLAMIKQARGEIASADALVQPYLDDGALPTVWRARVSRIHALALAFDGQGDAAWSYIQDSVVAAHAANEQRTLAWAYQDQASIAGRLGRTGAAEQALRLAERCWRDLNSPSDLALPLNARAMLRLGQRDYVGAHMLAQQARTHALSGGRVREAATASATCGDIAFAQAQYTEATLHYQTAEEEAEQCGDLALRAYALALQAQVAWLERNRTQAQRLLPRLQQHPVETIEHQGWLVSGMAAAQLTLDVEPQPALLERTLAQVGDELAEVRGALLIMLAQTYWRLRERHAALGAWARLEQLMSAPGSEVAGRIAPLATGLPALLDAVQGNAAPFACSLRQLLLLDTAKASGDKGARPRTYTLRIAVLGATEEVWWNDRPVTLPGHGLDLLLVLLLAAAPLDEDRVVQEIWGHRGVASHALRKLVVRLHTIMPGVIRRAQGHYLLALSHTEISCDLEQFLVLDPSHTASDHLLASAQAAAAGCLPQHSSPWAHALRRKVARRLALIWLELARRAAAEALPLTPQDAFDRAQAADPASDSVARAALQYALQVGDRSLAIHYYLRYQHALDAELGVEPASDLHALYLQALEP